MTTKRNQNHPRNALRYLFDCICCLSHLRYSLHSRRRFYSFARTQCHVIYFMQIAVRKTKRASALLNSEDEVTAKDDKKDFQQFKASKNNVNKKPREEVAPSELFGRKPITRVEETKVSRKLQKVVTIACDLRV